MVKASSFTTELKKGSEIGSVRQLRGHGIKHRGLKTEGICTKNRSPGFVLRNHEVYFCFSDFITSSSSTLVCPRPIVHQAYSYLEF